MACKWWQRRKMSSLSATSIGSSAVEAAPIEPTAAEPTAAEPTLIKVVTIIVVSNNACCARAGASMSDPTRTGARVSAAAVPNRNFTFSASSSPVLDHHRQDEDPNHDRCDNYPRSHGYLRRASAAIQGASQPVSAGSMNVPGSTTSSIASSTSSSKRRSAADSRSSNCSIVRGPMIAEVTAG